MTGVRNPAVLRGTCRVPKSLEAVKLDTSELNARPTKSQWLAIRRLRHRFGLSGAQARVLIELTGLGGRYGR